MTQTILTTHQALDLLAEVFVEPVASLKQETPRLELAGCCLWRHWMRSSASN
jgi:hypothetical protein